MKKLALEAPSNSLPEQGLLQQIQRWGTLAQQTSLQLQAVQEQMLSGSLGKAETAPAVYVSDNSMPEHYIFQLAQESLDLANQASARSQRLLTLAQKATAQLQALRDA